MMTSYSRKMPREFFSVPLFPVYFMKPFLLFLFFINLNFAFGQFTNILIDDNGGPEEPSIWINQKNTQNIVAGANLNFIYHSNDGGWTWQKQAMTSDYGVWGDPCIVSDTMGNFYFFHLSNPPNGNWIDRIVCQKSTDGGSSWSNGSFTGLNGAHAQDKEWAIFDPHTQNIYVTWTQFDAYGSAQPTDSSIILFSKSTDLGATWSTPKRINKVAGNCLDGDETTEGAVPAIGEDGEIYVSWSFNDAIYFDRSSDEGDTWLDEDIIATTQPGGWDYAIPGLFRCNGLPVTKCDLSNSAWHGTIYLNWSDQRNGLQNTDIFFAKSIDGGDTWSDPVKVNDDFTQTNQFLTWMDVDQTNGAIYVVFYDRRYHTGESTDVFLAYSHDGGTTFTNVKISDSSFIPNPSTFLGDYTNISAYDGKIVPIWTRIDASQSSLWTAQIDMTTVSEPAALSNAKHFVLYQNDPNPFSETTTIEMNIGESGYYTLTLFDLMGRKVADLLSNQFLKEGPEKVILNAKQLGLFETTYYYSLRAGNEMTTKQLVFIHH